MSNFSEEENVCPLCGESVRIAGFRGLELYLRCTVCNTTFLEPLPSLEDDLTQAANKALKVMV